MKPETTSVKCLLVDDVEDNLVALEGVLARDDVQIFKARGGRDALELLLIHDFALALIDVHMPGMDGFELAELMRGAERTRHVPIIFVTASTEPGRAFRGYDAGAVDYLVKPIDARALLSKTNTFFELHAQRLQLRNQLELLRESEELRRRMIESTHDFVAVLDRAGRVLTITSPGSRRIGDGAIGEPWRALFRPEDPERADGTIAIALSGRPGRFIAECVDASAHGTWWDVAVSPIEGGAKREERLLVIARDVTDQRAATREMEQLAARLQESLRLTETFVAAIGHDLRNPLHAMQMGVELLARDTTDTSARKLLDRLRTSTKRMTAMIEELHDLARARQGGGIALTRTPADLAAIAEPAVREIQTQFPEHTITFTATGDTAGDWDAPRLGRIVSNLVANAAKHGTPDQPVTVQVEGDQKDQVTLTVTNAGTIAPDVRATLFEPFKRRAQGNGNTASLGLGLGLYIVQQIAVAHGGRVEVDSTRETGTRFQVTLPRRAPRP